MGNIAGAELVGYDDDLKVVHLVIDGKKMDKELFLPSKGYTKEKLEAVLKDLMERSNADELSFSTIRSKDGVELPEITLKAEKNGDRLKITLKGVWKFILVLNKFVPKSHKDRKSTFSAIFTLLLSGEHREMAREICRKMIWMSIPLEMMKGDKDG